MARMRTELRDRTAMLICLSSKKHRRYWKKERFSMSHKVVRHENRKEQKSGLMRIITFEGIVEHGQIKLKTKVHLPDNTKVYVIVPDVQVEQSARITSPRLVHPEQAADFKMEIAAEPTDADV